MVKVSRQRIRVGKPARRIIGSYFIVTAIFAAFLVGLLLLAALELLLLG